MKETIEKLSKQLKIPKTVINEMFEDYYKAIKDIMEHEDFKKFYTEEEYNSQKHCFQIVCLGKLGVPYEFYKKIYDKRHAKNKKDNSDVQPNRNNDEEVCRR